MPSSPDPCIYRVTRTRSGSGVEIKVCNRRSLAGQIGLHNSAVTLERKYGYPRAFRILKIERAPLEPWQDVTEEFLNGNP